MTRPTSISHFDSRTAMSAAAALFLMLIGQERARQVSESKPISLVINTDQFYLIGRLFGTVIYTASARAPMELDAERENLIKDAFIRGLKSASSGPTEMSSAACEDIATAAMEHLAAMNANELIEGDMNSLLQACEQDDGGESGPSDTTRPTTH